MPLTKNTTLRYAEKPLSRTQLEPEINFRLVDEYIDLDNVSLNGGALVKTMVLSSDPYMRYRFRDPSIEMYCPPVRLGDP